MLSTTNTKKTVSLTLDVDKVVNKTSGDDHLLFNVSPNQSKMILTKTPKPTDPGKFKIYTLEDQLKQQQQYQQPTAFSVTQKMPKSSRHSAKPSIISIGGKSNLKGGNQDPYGALSDRVVDYTISDYRTSCRTCKEIDATVVQATTKKTKQYKAGTLLNTPNNNFSKSSKTSQQPKSHIDLEAAKKKLENTKGKIP